MLPADSTNMANFPWPRLNLRGIVFSPFCLFSDKTASKCTLVQSGARFYKGSARDTKRRKWNKKLAEVRKQTPKKYDYKQFISENYEKELSAFSHRLGLSPDNDLLRTALIHKSFLTGENTDSLVEHNGKLAVLGFNITAKFIGKFLFFSYSELPTCGLRALQDYLVSRPILVKVARSLSIPELIQTHHDLGSLDEIPEADVTKDIISDSLLAVIGSIYLGEGCANAQSFVHDFIILELYGQELERIINFKNPETSLTALLQEKKKERPVARLITSSGKYTSTPAYVVGIFSSNVLLAKAVSPFLHRAKQEAYCAALTRLLQDSMPPLVGLFSDKEINNQL